MIARLLRLLFGCKHPHCYVERRELYSLNILHWVCPDCDKAEPLITRTPDEHRDVIQAGAVRPYAIARVTKAAQNVTPIRARREK